MSFGLSGSIWTRDGDYSGKMVPDVPEINSIIAALDGDSIVFNLNTPCTFGLGGDTGFTVTLSGGACTLTYSSGDGTNALVYTTSRTIDTSTETGTADYVQPGDGVESVSDGSDLLSFSNEPVIINSIIVGVATPLTLGLTALLSNNLTS